MRLLIPATTIALLALGCSGGDSKPTAASTATATEAATQAPTTSQPPTTTPTRTDPENSTRWKLGDPIELGPGPGQLNLELYIEQGCTGCDGPPVTLERVSRDASGGLKREILFQTVPGSKYLTSTAVAGDGTLYTTACFGQCAEVGSAVTSGYTLIYSSSDGGATWAESEPSTSARRFISTALPDGQLVLFIRPQYAQESQAPEPTYWLHPSMTQLVPPKPLLLPEVTANPAEPIVWTDWEPGKFFRTDGSAIPVPAIGTGEGNGIPRMFGKQPPQGIALMWFDAREGRRDWHFALIDNGKVTKNFLGDDSTGAPWVQFWLDENRAIGRWNYSKPALFDFDQGKIHPIIIYDPVPTDPFIGRNKVIGYRVPD